MTLTHRTHIIGIRMETAVFLIIFLAGIFLRFFNLSHNSLWTDEFYTLRIAQAARLITEGIPSDQHPPLYNVMMHFVIAQGTGEFGLRLPSALFSSLGIVFMWRTGYAIGKPKLGLIAAALFAFAPLLIWYGRDARMYGVASFFWAGSLYFYTRTIYKDTWFDFLGLGLLTFAAIMTTYASFALWFVEIGSFFLLWYFAGHALSRFVKWLLAQAIIVIGFAFWFPYFQMQMGRSLMFNWKLPAPLDDVIDLSGTLAQTMTRALFLSCVGLLGVLLLSLIIIRSSKLQEWLKRWATPISILILFILALVTIGGTIQRGLSIRRQLLVFLPLLILVGAWALVWLNRHRLTGVFIAFTFICGFITALSPPFENWKDAIAYIEETAVTEDIIIVSPSWGKLAFDYYQSQELLLVSSNQEAKLNPTDLEQVTAEEIEQKISQKGQTVFIVNTTHPSFNWYSEALLDRFEGNGRLVEQTPFVNNIEVLVFEMD